MQIFPCEILLLHLVKSPAKPNSLQTNRKTRIHLRALTDIFYILKDKSLSLHYEPM